MRRVGMMLVVLMLFWPYKRVMEFESQKFLDTWVEIYSGEPERAYEVVGVDAGAVAEGYINPEKKILELLVGEVILEGGDALINYRIVGSGLGLKNKAVGKGDIIRWKR